eukprot:gene18761-biopygen17442
MQSHVISWNHETACRGIAVELQWMQWNCRGNAAELPWSAVELQWNCRAVQWICRGGVEHCGGFGQPRPLFVATGQGAPWRHRGATDAPAWRHCGATVAPALVICVKNRVIYLEHNHPALWSLPGNCRGVLWECRGVPWKCRG